MRKVRITKERLYSEVNGRKSTGNHDKRTGQMKRAEKQKDDNMD
jgi:hypothetical protein